LYFVQLEFGCLTSSPYYRDKKVCQCLCRFRKKYPLFLQNRCLYKHLLYIADTLGIIGLCFLNLCIIRPFMKVSEYTVP
jgi:hypothetical protein